MVEYLPVLIFLLVAIAFPIVGLLVSRIFLQDPKPEKVKLEAYECGIKPETSARARFSIRFYIIALLFVVFDVETVFLFPFAVAFDAVSLFAVFEVTLFILILAAGLVYVWRKGALEWV